MDSHEVLIAGAGPTGLMLAGELALAGVDVAIVERRPSQALAGSRAGGLHARTIEILDQRGIADRFISQGQPAQRCGFASVKLDLGDFPSRHAFTLGLWQNRFEEILAGWVEELGVRLYRGRVVTGFVQDEAGVALTASEGLSLRAAYLVGCDGGRSLVRRLAGIEFRGWDATASSLIAEVEMKQAPPLGIHRTALGIHSFGRLNYEIRDGEIVYQEGGPIRVMVPQARVGAGGEPTLQELSEALVAVCGTDYGVHDPTWISRFTDAARQAVSYRERRVLLAGDAAHVHSPVGGQGLNTGVQDAVNLGWKLAQVVKGISPHSLLDTYHAERHPVGARAIQLAMAGSALQRQDDQTGALRDTLADLLTMQEPRKRLAGDLSGLGIRHDLGEGHALLGRRMPDLELSTADGSRRVFSLLHQGRPVLLGVGDAPEVLEAGAPWSASVRCLQARCEGPWELPVVGTVEPPTGVLIRPDGHVAWVGEGHVRGLCEALLRWCGPPQVG